MDSRKRMTMLLLLSLFLSIAVAHQSEDSEFNSSPLDSDNDHQNSDTNSPQIQRRSGLYHGGLHSSGLHYHLPSAYAKSYYQPVVKYPVFKSFASNPLLHHHHVPTTYAAHPHYHLQHGGASVSSYNVNYPRYPLYRPILKVPTVVRPTVHSAPGYFLPSAPAVKPIIPIAINPVLPTAAAARPFIYPQPVFNPSILSGLNPQLIPVSVSNGAVFANYPTLAPTPLGPSAWKPIALPTVPTTITVQRPSISILPPFTGPASTVATLSDPVGHGHHHHHHFAQHIPAAQPTLAATSATVLGDDHHHHHQHHNFLTSGQGDLSGVYNFNQGFSSNGASSAAAAAGAATGHSGPSNTYLGPSSYDVDLHQAHQHNEQNNLYHSDGGYN